MRAKRRFSVSSLRILSYFFISLSFIGLNLFLLILSASKNWLTKVCVAKH